MKEALTFKACMKLNALLRVTEHYLLFLSAANVPASDRKDLLSELELMKNLKPHPHVIKLMGCVTENSVVLIFEKIIFLSFSFVENTNMRRKKRDMVNCKRLFHLPQS